MTSYEQTCLIAAALAQDPSPSARSASAAAYTTLYNYSFRRALPTVHRILYRRPSHEVEDMAHKAVTHALLNLNQFHGQAQYGTWLHRVVVNVTLMEVRRLAGRAAVLDRAVRLDGQVESRDDAGSGSNGDSINSRTYLDTMVVEDRGARWLEAADSVQYGVRDLPEKYRRLLELRLEGWSEKEIAAAEGITVLTVKARLFHGRQMMKRKLERRQGQERRGGGSYK